MNQQSSNRRQALLVIGMHRSGTSALTRVLNLHGAFLGADLLESAFDNEAGFWENRHVVDFHERLLAGLGSSWDDPRPLRRGWFDEARAGGWMDQLAALLRIQFENASLWAVKDPRLCRFLPLWLEVLQRLEVEPKLAFATRHPSEVVGSLIQRNGLSAGAASLLWLRHLDEPVQCSGGVARSMVGYDELLGDWRPAMARLARELDLAWPVASHDCAELVDGHLRRDLRHQHATTTQALLPQAWRDTLLGVHEKTLGIAQGQVGWASLEDRLRAAGEAFDFVEPVMPDLVPASLLTRSSARLSEAEQASAAYQAEAERLFRQASDALIGMGEAQDRVGNLSAELVEVQGRLGTLSAELVEAQSRLGTLNAELAEVRGELVKRDARVRTLEQAEAELERIKASRSWRWTRPLRFALRTLRHGGLVESDRRRLSKRLVRFDQRESKPQGDIAIESPRVEAQARLVAQSPGLRDFFVWAVIDWHFRIQRPQHLARELAAAGHRVFYISNNFVDHPEPGFSVEPLDDSGRLFQIRLHLQGSPSIYQAAPSKGALAQIHASLRRLLAWSRSGASVALVQHPYWLETAQILPHSWLSYDCMDHHGGFADNGTEVLAREIELMRRADLLVVTSDWLQNETAKHNPHSLMVRNACQYEHFAQEPDRIYRDERGRRIIGYYGAIAEWFDLALVEKVARRFGDCLVLLVGADTSGARERLQHLANIEFTGEVPYAELPYYLGAFDVCMLPFQVIPLTLATNPVKVYEYLSAGKEVVSIALPELHQFGDLVRLGADHASFLDAVVDALDHPADPALTARRQAFAAGQTWSHRAHDLVQGIEALKGPLVSVIVVTYNNLDLTKACLHSLEKLTDYGNLEVIVVDNASADETPAYLEAWCAEGANRRIVLNPDNRGFAAGNNQGLAIARGEYLVMLNNDTYVTPGWISTLTAHLRRHGELGMIGPVTNNIGNEARIDTQYQDMDGMLCEAAAYTAAHAGKLLPMRTVAFFCVMLRREVYEKVGPLDEAFGIGFFEDDDYCRRVEQAGWGIACAEDVFIHHHLSASFNKLKQERRQALFEENKAIYEAKWGPWVPHVYRDGAQK